MLLGLLGSTSLFVPLERLDTQLVVLLFVNEHVDEQIDEIEDFKNEEVICYCRSGQRSMMAATMLETFGFTDVKNLAGGMLGWKEKFGG